MADHVHGSMDPAQSEKAFAGLLKTMAYGFGLTAVVLIFLAFVGT